MVISIVPLSAHNNPLAPPVGADGSLFSKFSYFRLSTFIHHHVDPSNSTAGLDTTDSKSTKLSSLCSGLRHAATMSEQRASNYIGSHKRQWKLQYCTTLIECWKWSYLFTWKLCCTVRIKRSGWASSNVVEWMWVWGLSQTDTANRHVHSHVGSPELLLANDSTNL
jgi:hypothetical protein